MNDPSSILVEKRRANLRLRAVGLALVVLALLAARWFVYYNISFLFGIAVLFALELATASVLFRRLSHYGDPPRVRLLLLLAGQLQVLAELSLLTWAVYYTGGITSPLIPAYLIYIFADGLVASTRTLIAHVILASAFMSAVTVATYYAWLPRANVGLVPETQLWRDQVYVDDSLIVFGALMAVTLLVAITFSRRAAARELKLGESAGQLSMRIEQVNALREIGQRLASSLDLEAVMDAVVESALQLVKATDSHIFLYDSETRQFSDGAAVWADGHREMVVSVPRSDGLSARVAATGRPVIINDAESHPLFQSLQARAWGLKAIAGFPIIKSDRVLAVMNVAYLEPHHFTREEEQSLLALADQAAIAIDNALLYLQVQHKIQELSALNTVSQSAAQLTDLGTMLNDALGAVLSAVSADAALIGTYDASRGVLEMAAHRGLTATTLNDLKLHPLRAGEGLAGQVAQTGKPLFVLDPQGDARRVRKNNLDEFTSLYAVPLRAYDNTIGVLQLLWQERHQLTPTEANLCGALAPQLAVAMHNASLYYETKRRADELATLRSIGLATTSTLNLREQLRLLYENVNQLLRADTFFVGLYDETRDELRVEYIVEEGWFLRAIQVPLAQAGLSGWVIRNQKALLVDDLERTEALPTMPQHVTRPARSWLGVPLMLKERVVGLISAQSFQPNGFTASDERFLVAVAQHVALALDNARLFAESERRARELTLLNEISRAISASLDLDVVMDRAAHALSDQLGYHYVDIYQLEGEQLICKASVGDSSTGQAWDMGTGIIGRVARTGRAAFVLNVAADADYKIGHAEVVSEVCVPISRDGRVLGVVNVEESRPGALQEDDLVLLTVLSDQLAIAASNAALYKEALGRERFATRLGQLGMTASSTLDLAQLIETLCRESLTLFVIDSAAIYLREPRRDAPIDDSRAAPGRSGSLASDTALSALVQSFGEREQLVCRAAAGLGHDALLDRAVEIDQLGNVLARTLRLGRSFVLHDAARSPQLAPELRDAMQPEALLAVPILKERDVIGVLLLSDHSDAQRFGEPEIARAAIVASQAGLAISNARLFQEAQRRAKEQSSLYEIGLAISSTLDLQEQLHIIYEQVAKHFVLTGFDIALRERDELNFALFIDQGKTLEPFRTPLNDAGFAGWVVSSRRPLVIDDIRSQWDSLPVKPGERGTPNETASYIGIPLLIKAEAIGVMALQRFPAAPFTPDEQRFLFALAQQVAFAVDNARLHEQSQRNSAKQMLLYQASRRIAGALNLDTLLKAIVDALGNDLRFRRVLVMLLDPESNELRPAAASADAARLVTPAYHPSVDKGLMGLAAQTGQTQQSHDPRRDTLFDQVDDSIAEPKVAVPIKSGSNMIGVLNVESGDGRAFAPDDVRMFEAIADQLAVAIENAQLFASAQERLARINALQNIEVAILSTMNLTDRLDLILEHAVTQMRADVGIIYMRDPLTQELYGLRQRGSRDLKAFRSMRLKPGEGAAGWVMERGEPLYVPDVRRDARWLRGTAFMTEAIVSYLGVPLRVEDRTIGIIDVATRQPRLFTDEEINFFNTLASHAAVAIENARLYEQTQAQLDQLRNTQDRLVESERRAAIGELVAGLAHEINNPLTAIVGHSQLLLESMPGDTASDQWRGELDTISVAAQRIARIVQEFVTLTHVESGHAELVNFNALVSHAVQQFEGRDDAQDVAIITTLPPEPLMIRANPQLIGQVLYNILTNAIEAMPHGGRIDVQAGLSKGQMIFCSIRDSGYGIPSADLKRVFEPGYTTKVESGVVRGIGLGLYTAERIIKSNGGAIWLESQQGKYTSVTFTLPLYQGGERTDAN